LTNREDDDAEIGRRLLRLAADPVRFRILVLLNDRAASVREVAAELGLEAVVAARHLERLREEGFVEPAGEVLHRGAAEPRYRATVRALWSDEDWEAIGLAERRRLTNWIVEWICTEVRESVDKGYFTARTDSHVSRNVGMVDEQGWEELTRIQEDALEASFMVHEASGERLAERREEGLPVMSAMFCCELPPRPT
jgi:DNA-binding transcriptional ArsR family regulator